ncbi:MAG TPA: LysE family translocator [Syntrophomonadaceae bacterium]|nr:LysE family translocator [Syntrophomonadaceae bacterium]
MFGIENYGAFVLSAVALNLVPGQDTMYILGSSISNGRKAGILSALGISSGCIVHTVMAALGLSIVLSQSALAFNLVKYVGAAYLVYLGVRSFLSQSSLLIKKEENIKNNKKIFLQAIMTNVLNPKVALFFLAFLPQFIDPANRYGPLPFLLLGITFIFTGTIWGLVLAMGTSYFAGKVDSNPQVAGFLNKITGIIFMGLGLNLLRAKLAS